MNQESELFSLLHPAVHTTFLLCFWDISPVLSVTDFLIVLCGACVCVHGLFLSKHPINQGSSCLLNTGGQNCNSPGQSFFSADSFAACRAVIDNNFPLSHQIIWEGNVLQPFSLKAVQILDSQNQEEVRNDMGQRSKLYGSGQTPLACKIVFD